VTDQAVDLAPEGPERNQVNRSQEPQKPDAGVVVSGSAHCIFPISPKQFGDSGSERAVIGDQLVPEPRDSREAGNLAKTPKPKTAADAGPVAEQSKDRFRADVDRPIWLDQVDGGVKAFDRYVLSKKFSDRLERGEIHFFLSRLLPSPDPAKTKLAFRVVDEKRLLGWRGAVRQVLRETSLFHLLNSGTSHDSL